MQASRKIQSNTSMHLYDYVALSSRGK